MTDLYMILMLVGLFGLMACLLKCCARIAEQGEENTP